MENTTPTQPSSNMKNKILGTVGALAVVGVIGAIAYTQGKPSDTNTAAPTPPAPAPSIPAPSTTASIYKDGTYEADGTYTTPEEPETIHLSVNVKGGVITDATVTGNIVNKTSSKWFKAFLSGYKEAVVGKKLSDLKLTNVSGSSLTPHGFNTALEAIKKQAAS